MEPIKTPLVSIVTAFYNEEAFLEETILSVLAQTYENWELILVDDGSPDNSTRIARKYAATYPEKIFYYQHPDRANQGVCRSRNFGIEQARGEFIAYLDADDYWLPEKLSRQLDIFARVPDATVLMEASVYWYSWESKDRQDVTIPIGSRQDHLFHAPQLLFDLYPLGKGAAPCPSGMIVRRKVHDVTRFVEDFYGPTAVYEDQAFLAQLYLKENVYVSSLANNLYRQRAFSQVHKIHNNGNYHHVRKFYLDWFNNYLEKNMINDNGIRELLKKNLFRYNHPFLFRFLRRTGLGKSLYI
jgi:glycosyltransferase involved in cell wall biosynthesis